MDATALRWVLAIIGVVVIGGVYLFAVYQNRIRRQASVDTFTRDELENELIEDDHLREELSSISTMLDQDDLKDEVREISINPALDAAIKQRAAGRKAEPLHLPLPMQQIAPDKLIAHVLKHADDRVLTGEELVNAFRHARLELDGQGFARFEGVPDGCFVFANLSEDGSLREIVDPQFYSYGITCFFEITACAQPRVCYELMLKKVDELVRMLDLKVYNEELQLLTLQHVTDTRERLKAIGNG